MQCDSFTLLSSSLVSLVSPPPPPSIMAAASLFSLSGVIFAAGYWAVFQVIGEANWWLGALFGLLHALFAGTVLVNVLLPLVHPRMGTPYTAANETPLLEPPGFMLLNYGRATPVVTILAHVMYGVIVAEIIRLAST